MTREKTPFSTGLAAKIYWCVYVKPTYSYDIARIVYGKRNPPTSKVTQTLQKLVRNGYLTRDKEKIYHVVIDPLVSHLEEIMKESKMELRISEKAILKTLVSSSLCREFIEWMYPIEKLSEHEHGNISFMSQFTAQITRSAASMLDQIDLSSDKDYLSLVTSDHNKVSQKNKIKQNLIDKETYFESTVKKWSDSYGQLKDHVTTNNSQKNARSEGLNLCLFRTWLLILKYVPTSLLIKMTKLHPDMRHVHSIVTKNGEIFRMPRKDAEEYLKQTYFKETGKKWSELESEIMDKQYDATY